MEKIKQHPTNATSASSGKSRRRRCCGTLGAIQDKINLITDVTQKCILKKLKVH